MYNEMRIYISSFKLLGLTQTWLFTIVFTNIAAKNLHALQIPCGLNLWMYQTDVLVFFLEEAKC